MMRQRILGVFLVLLSILIVAMASQGTTPEEKDVTAILLILPLGLYAIFTKQKIVYDLPTDREVETTQEPWDAESEKTPWEL